MDRRIELIISKMSANMAAAWDQAKLAALVNLSPSRLRHLFKQETGSSPAQFLKQMRLRQAATMLRTTFLSVKQIVKEVGLGSNAHFVRDFRKLYRMTPTAYRRTLGRYSSKHRRSKKKYR